MYPLSVYSSVTFKFAHKAVYHQAQSISIAHNRSAILLPSSVHTPALHKHLPIFCCYGSAQPFSTQLIKRNHAHCSRPERTFPHKASCSKCSSKSHHGSALYSFSWLPNALLRGCIILLRHLLVDI